MNKYFKYSYSLLLIVSIILTFTSFSGFSLYLYYLSLLILIISLILYEWAIRPLYIFLVMINPYVLFTSLGILLDIEKIYPLIPTFESNIYIESFRIGLFALLGIALAIPLEGIDSKFIRSSASKDNSEIKLYSIFLLFCLFIAVIAQWAYGLKHRELLFEQYVLSANMDSPEYRVVTLIDQCIFCILLIFVVYSPDWKKYKTFWLILCMYFFFKVNSGGRTALVYISLLLFWRYYIERKSTLFENRFVKLIGFFAILFILGLIAFKRGGWRQASMGMESSIAPLYMFSKEFINGTFSILFSVYYVSKDAGPPFLLPLFDPFISLLPQFISGAREEVLYFPEWFKSIGGLENFSPRGGVFLAGQIYLFTRSLIGVFVFYYLLANFYRYMSSKLLKSNSKFIIMQSLIAISFLFVNGVRLEYWIFIKYIFLWTFIIPAIFVGLSEIILFCGRNQISSCQPNTGV